MGFIATNFPILLSSRMLFSWDSFVRQRHFLSDEYKNILVLQKRRIYYLNYYFISYGGVFLWLHFPLCSHERNCRVQRPSPFFWVAISLCRSSNRLRIRCSRPALWGRWTELSRIFWLIKLPIGAQWGCIPEQFHHWAPSLLDNGSGGWFVWKSGTFPRCCLTIYRRYYLQHHSSMVLYHS